MPRIVRWCLTSIVAAGACFLAANYALCIWHACSSSRFDLAFLAALCLAAAAVGLSAVIRHRWAWMVPAAVVPALAALYLFEATGTSARDVYSRTLHDAIRDYRARGIAAAPQWSPFGFAAGRGQMPLSDGTSVVPLTGPSDRLVVMCQEGDRPLTTYQADGFGLNNPPEAWGGRPDIVLVGDSFTHGACVERNEHFVHAIRQAYPATINLGYSGNGPLLELAAIREYAARLRPHIVFWMYDESNDVLPYSPPADLDVEITHPVLARYLDADFTQGLFARQGLVNAALNRIADGWLAATDAPAARLRRLMDHVTLPTTREALRGAYVRLRVAVPFVVVAEPPLPPERMEQFTTIMRLAASEVRGFGGRLVFVNLPAQLSACLGRDHPARTAILDVPRQLGLDVVDLEGPLFNLARREGAHVIAGDGRCGGHYSPAGYAVVADVLLQYLRIADGGIDLPSGWSDTARPDGTRQLILAGTGHDRAKPLHP